MAFALDPRRPIPKALKKAVEGELGKSVEGLTGQAELGPDEAAHDARKRTEKVRALLRLARPELGDKVYRRENRALRDAAARLLSPVRDEAFEEVLAGVSRWPLKDQGWASLDDGLEDTFRRGRQAMGRARSKGRTDDFHEWRKQVKYLRHHFALLREVWPEVLEAMEDTADELGERLGADHDLAVLRERVEAEQSLASHVRKALLRRIDTRREEHQQTALALGSRLYAEKPAALRERLGRLWNAAA